MDIQVIIAFFLVLIVARKVFMPKVQSENIVIHFLRKILLVKKIEINHGKNTDELGREMLLEDIKRSKEKDVILIFSGSLFSKIFMDDSIEAAAVDAIETKNVKFDIITERAPDDNVFSKLLDESPGYKEYINIKRLNNKTTKRIKHFRVVGDNYYYLEHKHDDNERIFERVENNLYNTNYIKNKFESLKRLSH